MSLTTLDPKSNKPVIERRRYDSKLADVTVPPPIFLLGHWRSGTTHLHNLMAVDQRWSYPNNYHSLYPHVFLTSEAINSRLLQPFMPPRRPMDNVECEVLGNFRTVELANSGRRLGLRIGWG